MARASVPRFRGRVGFSTRARRHFRRPGQDRGGRSAIAPPDSQANFALCRRTRTTAERAVSAASASTTAAACWPIALWPRRARSRARHRFFHWEIGFPECLVESALGSSRTAASTPLSAIRPMCGRNFRRRDQAGAEEGLRRFDGMADLYVYFYEQGLAPAASRRTDELRRYEQMAEGRLRGSLARAVCRAKGGSSSSPISATPSTFFPMRTCSRPFVVVRKPLRGEDAPSDDPGLRHPPRCGAGKRPLRGRRRRQLSAAARVSFTEESWTLRAARRGGASGEDQAQRRAPCRVRQARNRFTASRRGLTRRS